jgi:hypothetical protein
VEEAQPVTLVRRTSTVRCDLCKKAEVTVEHDVDFECDAGYAFGQALQKAGWQDVWIKRVQGYGHVCPPCFERRSKK